MLSSIFKAAAPVLRLWVPLCHASLERHGMERVDLLPSPAIAFLPSCCAPSCPLRLEAGSQWLAVSRHF
jgi:hypothetical protein